MIFCFFKCKFLIFKFSLICFFWRIVRCILFILLIVIFFFVFFGCLSNFNGSILEVVFSLWLGIVVLELDICIRLGIVGYRLLDLLVVFFLLILLNSLGIFVLIVDFENWVVCKYWYIKIKINIFINFSYVFVISRDYFKFFVW